MAEKALNPEDKLNLGEHGGIKWLSRAAGRAVSRYRHHRQRPEVWRPVITCFNRIGAGQTCGPVEVSVENKWNTSGKLVGRGKNWHDMVFIWSPRRRTRSMSASVYGPVPSERF